MIVVNEFIAIQLHLSSKFWDASEDQLHQSFVGAISYTLHFLFINHVIGFWLLWWVPTPLDCAYETLFLSEGTAILFNNYTLK